MRLKLLAVGHDIDETGADSIKNLLDRGFHLKEHEEVLLEMILNRDEQDEENDPFDPYLMAMEALHCDSSTVAQSMEDLDNRLMDFALDHDWDDCSSMADMSTLRSSSIHKRIPGLAQLSKRLCSSTHTAPGASTQGKSHRLSAISEEASMAGSVSGCGMLPGQASTVTSGATQPGEGNGKKRQVDYLRQMREERDLQQMCDVPLLLVQTLAAVFQGVIFLMMHPPNTAGCPGGNVNAVAVVVVDVPTHLLAAPRARDKGSCT